jgi:hypothetical protein
MKRNRGSQAADAYVEAIEQFVAIGCTTGSSAPETLKLHRSADHRSSLETVQNALLIGTVRKYVSGLNGGSREPIGSLAYFLAVVSETRDRPIAPDYQEYLKRKIGQLKKVWEKESAKTSKNRGCLNIPCSEIVQ